MQLLQTQMVEMLVSFPSGISNLGDGLLFEEFMFVVAAVRASSLSRSQIIYEKFDMNRRGYITFDDFERVRLLKLCGRWILIKKCRCLEPLCPDSVRIKLCFDGYLTNSTVLGLKR
jgi:hypothetical protein